MKHPQRRVERTKQVVPADRLRGTQEQKAIGSQGIVKALEHPSPLRQRLAREVLAAETQQVEQHQLGGAFGRQLSDPALGRVEAKLQGVERERVTHRDDQFAVEEESPFLDH